MEYILRNIYYELKVTIKFSLSTIFLYMYLYIFCFSLQYMHVYQIYSKTEPKCLETQEKSKAGNCSKPYTSAKVHIQTVPEILGTKQFRPFSTAMKCILHYQLPYRCFNFCPSLLWTKQTTNVLSWGLMGFIQQCLKSWLMSQRELSP